MSEARAVYVGDRATEHQVDAAIRAWQRQTGDTTRYVIEADADGHERDGMGIAVDICSIDWKTQDAAVDRLAAGIRPLLAPIPVAADRELEAFAPAPQ